VTRLTDHELEQLLSDAERIDRYALIEPMTPRIRRLLEEQRELRDQAGERERMAAEEIGG
jgi:hypothetical protein